MKKSFLLAVVAQLAFAGMARGDDHGDTPATATPLAVGTVAQGVLNATNDADFFQSIWAPGAWLGFALFYDNRGIDINVGFDNIEGANDSDFYDTFVWENPFDVGFTNYPNVRYSSLYSGSGGDEYHLAAVQFPDAASPLDALIDFTLSSAHPADARWFSLGAGKLYAISMGRLDGEGDIGGLQSVYWKDESSSSASGGSIVYQEHVNIEFSRKAGNMRTLVHNPRWNEMSSGGDPIGLRVQEIVPLALSGGLGTGRIPAPCDVDVWTGVLEPKTNCAAWLTHPDGRLVEWYEYNIGVFSWDWIGVGEVGGWGKYSATEKGMLTFESYDPASWSGNAFTVFSSSARDQDYTLHVQSYVDDYGQWEGNTPAPGAAMPNVYAGGKLEVPPDEDGFRIPMQAGKTYAFYSPDEDRFHFSMDGDGQWGGNYWSWGLFVAPESGTGTVQVAYDTWNSEATTGAYQFVVSEFMDDADNVRTQAIPLTVGGPAVANDLKAPGDQDWFVFNVETGKTYALTGGAGRELRIYFNNNWASWIGEGPSLTFPVDYTGPCYVTVRAAPTAGNYAAQVVESGGQSDYDAWAGGYEWGGKPAGPDDDADGDGFSNNEERIAGTNPTLQGDLFKATTATHSASGNGLVLGTALAGRVYSARYTANLLLDWSLWLSATITIEDGKIVAAIDPARPNAIYRLIVALE